MRADVRKGFAVAVFLFHALVPSWASPVMAAQDDDPDYLATYSIIARDPGTGELGMGVQSKAFAAGNRAMHAKGGVAVIAHQASANPMYGAIGVDLIERGYSPQEALDMMVASDEGRDRRQVAILDMEGRTAAWTGTGASDWKGHRCGRDYCAQGNILVGPEVVDAMAASFEASSGPLAEPLRPRAGTRAASSRAPSWWWLQGRGAEASATGWLTSGWTTMPRRCTSSGACSTSSDRVRWCGTPMPAWRKGTWKRPWPPPPPRATCRRRTTTRGWHWRRCKRVWGGTRMRWSRSKGPSS